MSEKMPSFSLKRWLIATFGGIGYVLYNVYYGCSIVENLMSQRAVVVVSLKHVQPVKYMDNRVRLFPSGFLDCGLDIELLY